MILNYFKVRGCKQLIVANVTFNKKMLKVIQLNLFVKQIVNEIHIFFQCDCKRVLFFCKGLTPLFEDPHWGT